MGPGFVSTVLQIFLKDLRIEIRTREILSATLLFALLVVLLSAFAFGLNASGSIQASAGVLWIAVAFSGLLGLSRTYLRERENQVWQGMLLLPVSRGALFVGKMLGVALFLFVVALALVPIIALFFHAPMLANFHRLLPVMALAVVGFAAVGTLFGAMTIQTRLRDVLLGVILYPLISPVLIAAVKATEALLLGDGLAAVADYLELLALVDILYISGGLWLFGPMMED